MNKLPWLPWLVSLLLFLREFVEIHGIFGKFAPGIGAVVVVGATVVVVGAIVVVGVDDSEFAS